MKRFLIGVLMLMGMMGWAFEDFWAERNTLEGAKKGYETLRSLSLQQPDSYEVAWKFARAAYHYAENFVKDKNQRKVIFTEGKEAAEKATRLNPNAPEGWYWLGVCLGSWGEANGIMQSLGAVKPIMNAIAKGMAVNPTWDNGVFYNLRGRVYHRAPAGISVGDKQKAEADYKQALTLNPNNRTACRFYAELLLDVGRKEEAAKMIEKGLAIPYDASNKVSEDKEISLLQALKKKL
ncbi:MAG: tetratricopeptide repeat protein [Brevinematales bacterium]|nr:tetratricopeptide repeat protein [Brevinematales bacterium]